MPDAPPFYPRACQAGFLGWSATWLPVVLVIKSIMPRFPSPRIFSNFTGHLVASEKNLLSIPKTLEPHSIRNHHAWDPLEYKNIQHLASKVRFRSVVGGARYQLMQCVSSVSSSSSIEFYLFTPNPIESVSLEIAVTPTALSKENLTWYFPGPLKLTLALLIQLYCRLNGSSCLNSDYSWIWCYR